MRSHATLSSFAVFALAGCAGLQVQTDYDPEASSAELSTYDEVEEEAGAYVSGNPALDSPLLKRHIRGAVEAQLGRMGYRKVTSDTPELGRAGEGELGRTGSPKVTSNAPDFRIAYSVIAEREASYGYGSYGFGGPYGYRGSSYRGSSLGFSLYGGRYLRPYYSSYYGYPGAGYGGTGGVRESLRGTLVLDITDVRTEEVIFRGWARKSLHYDPSPEKLRMYVNEAVEEILEDFPRAGSASGQLVAP